MQKYPGFVPVPPQPPTQAQFTREAMILAAQTTSPTAPCSRCGWPFVHELACNFCGTVKPEKKSRR